MTMKSFHTSNNNNSNNSNNKKPKNRMRRSLLACSGDLKGIDPASSLEQPTNNTKKNNNNNKKSVATGTKANNDNNDKPVIQLNKKNKNKKTRPPKAFLSVLSQPFAPWNELEMVIGEQQQQQLQQQQQQDDDDNNTMSYISPTARSFLVQHLVRFLELKILTEEFATSKLLAPSPIIAQAWRAVILSANNNNKNSNNNSNSNKNSKDQNQHSDLYRRVLYDIQDFHERPHRMLTFGLSKEELSTKATAAMQQQQQRTQHLFQYYYGEPMLTSIDDLDTDLSLLTDTSTITDMMGLYLPRCGGGGGGGGAAAGQPTNKKQSSSSCHHINKKMIISDDDGWSHPWIWSLKWLEAVSDVLFCAPHGEDSSVARTVSLDDDDDDDDEQQQQQNGELLKDPQQQQQQDETEYDSLFTFDFLNTRHFLCRGGAAAATAAATATETTAHASSCHHHSPYSAFAW